MSASDVCRRQILTSKDDLSAERIKTFIMVVDPYFGGIQMSRKEVTKTFMMILN